MGTYVIKRALEKIIQSEDKTKPMSDDALVGELVKLGYKMASVLDMNQVYYQYLDSKDVSRIQRLELFDELEEWHLIQGHYCIAVAINDMDKVVVDDNNSNNVSYDDEGNLKPKRKNDDQPPSSLMMIITNTIKFYLKEEKVPSFFNKYMD